MVRRRQKAVEAGPQGRKRPRIRNSTAILAVLLVFAGVATLVYPVAATIFNNYRQQQFADQYQHGVSQIPPEQLGRDLANAQKYNDQLTGVPILDPWLSSASGEPKSASYRAYEKELSAFGAMARIRIPKIAVNLPIMHGTSDDTLAQGVGHLYGTSLPVGGPGTHSVLTAHTAFPTATLFDRLVDLKDGDVFYIDVSGQTLAYRVDQIKVVLPDQIEDLKPVAGADNVTLVTCTPFAVNTHRLLVRGTRIDYDPATAPPPSVQERLKLQPWMGWPIAGAVTGPVLLLGLALRRRRTPAARAD